MAQGIREFGRAADSIFNETIRCMKTGGEMEG
jgi:hypothetical protein